MNSIFWFRQDLRLSDNPGLIAAANSGQVLPIYIWDEKESIGSASKIYLYHSLQNLNQSLNNKLNFYIGDPKVIIQELVERYNITGVFCNKCYEPYYVTNDTDIDCLLQEKKIKFNIFDASYLWNPENIKNEAGDYYKVFTPYKKKVYTVTPRKPLSTPKELHLIHDIQNQISLADLHLMSNHRWETKIIQNLSFGEENAHKKLNEFIEKHLTGYKIGRNYPSQPHTSKLSINLHFGEISPHQIWYAVNNINCMPPEDVEHFLSELIWREFSCYLMYWFKKLPFDNFQSKFDRFPWKYDELTFKAWTMGKTGYPIIDAGMRQLWQTGYMHNRVRMIVASFLVKNLMIHWHYGRDWFWDCLLDADLANNSASWQWVAGCGADAAPYFRIFNPIVQGEKFDQDGVYTKQFVPELASLPTKYLFQPWNTPQEILQAANVSLGKDYPYPIINLEQSRDKALEAYNML